MQAVWEANTSGFRKRKRVVRACSVCQKRKRKCHHTFAEGACQQPQGFHQARESESSTTSNNTYQLSHLDSVRFVGDLNPESVLADLGEHPKGNERQSRIGVWIEARRDGLHDHARAPPDEFHTQGGSSSSRQRSSTIAPRHPQLLSFLRDIGAYTVLPLATQKALIDIYVSHVHPFLPLVDVGSFLSTFQHGKAPSFLVLAICLTAGKSSEAAPFLRWEAEGPVLPARVFAKRLFDGLHFALNTGQETDPLVRIQILGLLALHNDSPRGLENASLHLCQAIHHAHTLGLHINSARTFSRNEHTERTFWSLWCLDKFHACMAGRPVMIFDQDIGLARPTDVRDAAQTPFHQHVSLCGLLGDIIYYYRPTTDQDSTGWEEGFPTLEECAGNRSDLPKPNSPVVIELLYHVAAIIACRVGIVGAKSYNRREAAANQIDSILRSDPSIQTSPLPVASYAASLSMTVAYRKLRDEQSTEISPANVKSLADRCEMLERFSARWWSAEAMAMLGRKALRNIQELSKIRCHDQESTATSTTACHDADVVNPLDMLSSVAESHSRESLPNELSQTLAGPGDLLLTDGTKLEIEERNQEDVVPFVTHVDFDPLQDLDLAFGDFFDLSMPTTFFDPLFEQSEVFDFSKIPE